MAEHSAQQGPRTALLCHRSWGFYWGRTPAVSCIVHKLFNLDHLIDETLEIDVDRQFAAVIGCFFGLDDSALGQGVDEGSAVTTALGLGIMTKPRPLPSGLSSMGRSRGAATVQPT